MSRNLLPLLRSHPTPANIAPGTVGAWSTIANPGELAKIEYQADEQEELRTSIQSIPSPWARMLLFRAALEDPGHPARKLVENEILDALEFSWSLNRLPGVALEFRRVEVEHLPELGDRTGSRRARDFAAALRELVPRIGSGRGHPAVTTITLALAQGRPVFASSPYSLLFTAEDAAEHAGVERFFDLASGGRPRRLCERPIAFQEYLAQVILPQLYLPAPDASLAAGWGRLQGIVRPWLESEIDSCVSSASDEDVRARVRRPTTPGETDWRRVAEQLGLEPIDGQAVGGVLLFRQRPGQELATSPYRLESTRPVPQAPLVVTADRFDGVYFHGAQRVVLPPDLRPLDRGTLPGLGIRYPWVSPVDDWFTDRLVLLSEPIERDHVHGYGKYRWRGSRADPRFSEPHMLLPLRREFFEYFTNEDIDRLLSIDVHGDGRIEVALSVPIHGENQVTVSRTYDEGSILNEHGPAFSLWPSFRDDRWPTYVLFRRDTTQAVAQQFALHAAAAGEPVPPTGQERRTPLVEITAFDRAPEVLELRSTLPRPGSRSESVGVIVPRYRPTIPAGPGELSIGVDFGTSNTVISVRGIYDAAPTMFEAANVSLPLSEQSEATRHLIDAYFFPAELKGAPFGTAVVYHESLRSYELDQEPIGLRVNVPYTGDVDGYRSNRVKGDLKWSADEHAHFLSASFLRHVIAAVIADAMQRGVDPARISFTWAYPRAFSPSQLNQLRQHWHRVLASFKELGVTPAALKPELDESSAVLRHFFNQNLIQPAGDIKAVVDIGGGTSDIAFYGSGQVLALDSVILGGRNLTGSRPQRGTSSAANPFVDAFFAWAREHGLPEENLKAVETYLERDQVHLAFSYLVGTRWFQQRRGELFTGDPAFHKFQLLVFYFFGALFYYLGLSLRSLPSTESANPLPTTILLAGNGSRYLDWLTDLVHHGSADNVFTRALGRVLAVGAAVDGSPTLPRVRSSDEPKEEVARGLIVDVGPGELPDHEARTTSVVGEAVTFRAGDAGTERVVAAADRFDPRDLIEAAHARHLSWGGDALEIDRFHDTLVFASEELAPYGSQWIRASQSYRDLLAEIPRSEIQNLTEGRLQYLAQLENGFRGSLFLLEATIVLEEMRDRLFR